jgi:nitroreductase
MNEVIQQLYDRKSVRVFTEQPIGEDAVQQILMSAAMAPTAGNQQLYTILRITDPALKESLAESCDHQPFIAEGKLVLVFCADCLKWYDAFISAGCQPRKPGEGDLLLAVSDALIAAQNAVVAAHALGIGSCYIGDIMENAEIHRKTLALPDYVFPAAMLVFGYPTQKQLERKKPERVELQYVVHENAYHRLDDRQLRDMFAPRCGEKSYEDWMQAFCNRKYNSDFSREMTRSVREYLKQYVE